MVLFWGFEREGDRIVWHARSGAFALSVSSDGDSVHAVVKVGQFAAHLHYDLDETLPAWLKQETKSWMPIVEAWAQRVMAELQAALERG